jgi:MoxR-like ATPase
MSNYISLSLNEAAAVILDAWQSDPHTAPLLIGPPGIGKTEIIRDLTYSVAQMLAPDLIARGVMPDPRPGGTGEFPAWGLASLEAAHSADEDIGGIPVRDAVSGAVMRLPIGPLRKASEGPCVAFFDECSRAGAQKQGCLLTLTNEGRAGDFKFHPGTRAVLAANGAESSGTHSIIDALLNRCLVIEVHAVVAEVIHYLMNRVGTQGSSLRELAIDYAMTSEKAAGLIEVDPPPGATEAGAVATPGHREGAEGLRHRAQNDARACALRFARRSSAVAAGCTSRSQGARSPAIGRRHRSQPGGEGSGCWRHGSQHRRVGARCRCGQPQREQRMALRWAAAEQGMRRCAHARPAQVPAHEP